MIGNKEVLNISIEDIIPNRFQPRLAFGEKELNELADSIKQHGVIQPLLLRKIGDKYEIIAGERRYKASCIAGLNNVPAIIVETDDNTSAEIAITENIQRKDLTAIEEAQSYKKLINKGETQEEIAKKLGIGQSTVANKVRLLALTEEAQDALLSNRISERHARSLLRITDAPLQINLLNRIINEKLTVKQTEDEINELLGTSGDGGVLKPPFNIEIPNFGEEFKPLPKEVLEPKPYKEAEIFEPKDNDKIINIIDEDSKILSPFEKKEEDEEEFFLENPIKVPVEIPNTNNDLINEFKSQKEEEIENVESLPEKPQGYIGIVNKTRSFIRDLENKGEDISTEEFDFEDMYQIVIKIKKDE